MWSTVAHAAEAAQGAAPSMVEQFVPMIAIVIAFYFFLIRPQSRRHKEHQDYLQALKKGDSVLTSGGLFGTIEGLTEKFVTLEIAQGTKVRVLRSAISSSANAVEEKK